MGIGCGRKSVKDAIQFSGSGNWVNSGAIHGDRELRGEGQVEREGDKIQFGHVES